MRGTPGRQAEEPENDLAVLRPYIIPDDLVPATLTSSATLRVGDEVVAVTTIANEDVLEKIFSGETQK